MTTPYPPLVPPHPTPTADGQLVANLCELVEVERGLRDLCRVAVDAVAAKPMEESLASLTEHANRALHTLTEHLEQLGASAPTAKETRQLLPASEDDLQRATSEEQVLQWLERSIAEVDRRYTAARGYASTPEPIREALDDLQRSLSAAQADLTSR